jgi:hypothetical protein
MALKKKIMTRYGIECEYWKIIYAQIDYRTNAISFDVAGYPNQEARLANHEPVERRNYYGQLEQFTENDIRIDLYNHLKNPPEPVQPSAGEEGSMEGGSTDPKGLEVKPKDTEAGVVSIFAQPITQDFKDAEDI